MKTYQDDGEGGLKLYAESHLGIGHQMDLDPAFESGGAGLVSTIDDSAKFTTMLMNQGSLKGVQLLKPGTVKYLTSAALTDWQQKGFDTWHTLRGHSYGNQMRIMTDCGKAGFIGSQGEYGWDGWLGAYFSNSPQEGLTILFMIQKRSAARWQLRASCAISCSAPCKGQYEGNRTVRNNFQANVLVMIRSICSSSPM